MTEGKQQTLAQTETKSQKEQGKAKRKRTSTPRKKKFKILFVCTGNTCRSAMANYIFISEAKKLKKISRFVVSSAGLAAETGGDMSEEAKHILTLRNVAFPKHNPQQLNVSMVEKADYVICMTSYHKYAIEAVTGERKNLFTADDFDGHGDVGDPYGGGEEIYADVAERLFVLCDSIIYKLCPREPEKINTYML